MVAEEWDEALGILREELIGLEATSVLQQIDQVTSRRVEVYKTTNEIVRAGEIPGSKETQKRSQTPKEAFTAAVEVLESWLIELPSIGEKIVANLGGTSESIVWKPDVSEEERKAEGEEFSVGDFQISDDSKEEIRESILQIRETTK